MSENYQIRGITFSKVDLQEISFEKLKGLSLCPGHLYYFSKIHNKPIFMLQAGDLIEDSFIARYQNAGIDCFYILNFVDFTNAKKYEHHFENLKLAKTESQRWSERNQIVDLFKLQYIFTKKTSILEFVLSAHQNFSKIPKEVLNEYLQVSDSLLRRSMLTASLASLIALSIGYVEFEFIQDIYHASFLRDYGLVSGQYNYIIQKACELERTKPGTGLESFKNEEDRKYYFSHPQIGYEKIVKNCKQIFNYPELIDSVRYHHELANGSGFPNKFNYYGMSDYEVILNFVEYITPYAEIIYSKNTDYSLLDLISEAVKNKILMNTPTKRIYEMVVSIFSKGQEPEEKTA